MLYFLGRRTTTTTTTIATTKLTTTSQVPENTGDDWLNRPDEADDEGDNAEQVASTDDIG